jgi:hypothetical protein
MKAQLSVAVTTASGAVYRWGPEEWEAANIPQAITFSTAMPGGFKAATIVLPRRIDLDYPDLNLLDQIEIIGPGAEVLWEGRIQQLPRSHADSPTITVGAVGYSAHLMDDASFREIYVGRDLGEWTELSAQWRLGWGTSFSYAGYSVAPDSGEGRPSIVLQINDSWSAQRPVAAAMYDAGPGLVIANLDYDWAVTDSNSGWILEIYTGDNDIPTGGGSLGDLATGAASGNGELLPNKRVIAWQWVYSGPGGVLGSQYRATIRRLTWFGDHGLTIRGERPNRGLYASDVIADVISRAAPLLNFSTGADGTIQPTTFIIPHLVFREPTTANAVVMRANGYHLWDWAVWEDKTFFFRPPDPDRLTWEARLSDGAHLDLEGTQVDDVYNGVIVQYGDPAGVSRTVGPPNSGADATDASLEDASATNPVNAHGIPKKWATVQVSQTTTEAGAIQLGAILLGEKGVPQRRGALTVTGTIAHPMVGDRPVCEMRAGDWVRISDHPTDVPRKIIETSYDSNTQTLTCTLDNTSQKVDAILERLGVSLMGVL